jgi:hypothetical protein
MRTVAATVVPSVTVTGPGMASLIVRYHLVLQAAKTVSSWAKLPSSWLFKKESTFSALKGARIPHSALSIHVTEKLAGHRGRVG